MPISDTNSRGLQMLPVESAIQIVDLCLIAGQPQLIHECFAARLTPDETKARLAQPPAPAVHQTASSAQPAPAAPTGRYQPTVSENDVLTKAVAKWLRGVYGDQGAA